MHIMNSNSLLRCGLGDDSSDGLQAVSSEFIRALAEKIVNILDEPEFQGTHYFNVLDYYWRFYG